MQSRVSTFANGPGIEYTSCMSSLTKRILGSGAVLALALTMSAQDKGKSADKGKAAPAVSPKILQPQMTVTEGTYAAPHGKLGEKPAQPWSATTVGAAVDGKPPSEGAGRGRLGIGARRGDQQRLRDVARSTRRAIAAPLVART